MPGMATMTAMTGMRVMGIMAIVTSMDFLLAMADVGVMACVVGSMGNLVVLSSMRRGRRSLVVVVWVVCPRSRLWLAMFGVIHFPCSLLLVIVYTPWGYICTIADVSIGCGYGDGSCLL